MLVAPASLIPLPVNTARDRLARAALIANRSHEVPTCPLSFRHRQGKALHSGLAEGGLFRHAAAPPKQRYRDVIARRKSCFHAQQKGRREPQRCCCSSLARVRACVIRAPACSRKRNLSASPCG